MSDVDIVETEDDTVIVKLESSVKDIDTIKWNRDTGNPYIDTAELFEDGIGCFINIDGNSYEVRMPDRRLTKQYLKMTRRIDNKRKQLKMKTTEMFSLEDSMEAILLDSIIDLDFDKVRLTDIDYNNLSAFFWEFFNFFAQRSSHRMRKRVSSSKGR